MLLSSLSCKRDHFYLTPNSLFYLTFDLCCRGILGASNPPSNMAAFGAAFPHRDLGSGSGQAFSSRDRDRDRLVFFFMLLILVLLWLLLLFILFYLVKFINILFCHFRRKILFLQLF